MQRKFHYFDGYISQLEQPQIRMEADLKITDFKNNSTDVSSSYSTMLNTVQYIKLEIEVEDETISEFPHTYETVQNENNNEILMNLDYNFPVKLEIKEEEFYEIEDSLDIYNEVKNEVTSDYVPSSTDDDSSGSEFEPSTMSSETPEKYKCNKAETRKYNLQRLKCRDKNPKHKCYNCDAMFTQKSQLESHMSIHTGKKPYKCEICNKYFSQKVNLSDHEFSHVGLKPYICNLCNASFSCRSNLNKHKASLHTGILPHKCSSCNKGFTYKSQLISHEIIHDEQRYSKRKYKCTICPKTFTYKSQLKVHGGVHDIQKKYKCILCNMAFSYQATLNKHMVRYHK